MEAEAMICYRDLCVNPILPGHSIFCAHCRGLRLRTVTVHGIDWLFCHRHQSYLPPNQFPAGVRRICIRCMQNLQRRRAARRMGLRGIARARGLVREAVGNARQRIPAVPGAPQNGAPAVPQNVPGPHVQEPHANDPDANGHAAQENGHGPQNL